MEDCWIRAGVGIKQLAAGEEQRFGVDNQSSFIVAFLQNERVRERVNQW